MESRSISFNHRIIIFFFTGLFVLSYLLILDDHIYYLGDDFAQYIQHARNICRGDPYSNLPYPFNPEAQIGPPAYPPLYPFLISTLACGEIPQIFWMKTLSILLFALSLPILYKIFFSLKENSTILGAIFVFAFLPWIFLDAGSLGSDTPYAFLSFLALWSLILLPNNQYSWMQPIITGLLIALSTLTRDIGIALFVSSLLYLGQKVWKNPMARPVYLFQMVLISLAFLIPLGCWKFYQYHLGLGPANNIYFSTGLGLDNFTFYGFGLRLASNAYYYLQKCYELLFPLSFLIYPVSTLNWLRFPITFLILGILIWQLLKGFRSSFLPIVLYMGCYLGVLLIMDFHISKNGTRMLIPLAPFLVFFTLKGIKELSPRLGFFPSFAYRVILIFWIGLSIWGSFYLYSSFRDPQRVSFSPNGSTYQAIIDYIRKEIPDSERIAYVKPRYLSLYSQHQTAILPFMGPPSSVGPPSKIIAYLSHWKITYVLLDDHFKEEEQVTRQAIKDLPQAFSVVYSSPPLTLLRFSDPGSSRKDIHHSKAPRVGLAILGRIFPERSFSTTLSKGRPAELAGL